nr:hypothetical protein [candidate division Zixibacteria bacterium]
MSIIYLVLAFIGVISNPVLAGEISLTGTVDRTEMAFEDRLNLELQIRWQGVITDYTFEIMPLPTTENLKVVGTSSTISSTLEDGVDYTTRSFKYSLQPTGSGIGAIEPVTFNYVSLPDSIPGQLTTQRFTVQIAKPAARPQETGTVPYIIIYVTILVIIAAVVAVIIIIRKKRAARAVPEPSLEDKFRDQMETLKKEAGGDRQLFFTRFYRLILLYLESKFGIKTAGKTTALILANLEKTDMPPERQEKIAGWLKQAEQEKFAPGRGTPGDVMRIITEVDDFLR